MSQLRHSVCSTEYLALFIFILHVNLLASYLSSICLWYLCPSGSVAGAETGAESTPQVAAVDN